MRNNKNTTHHAVFKVQIRILNTPQTKCISKQTRENIFVVSTKHQQRTDVNHFLLFI